MKKKLTEAALIVLAKKFCVLEHNYHELFGVTDGKAIGTFVEHKIRDEIEAIFDVVAGNSALGLDLPSIETDIKVTSLRQPQSSCPFRSARQKIYGLGYNLLLLVYEKNDDSKTQSAQLHFAHCSFIDKSRTGDYQLTRSLRQITEQNGNREDVLALLMDRNLPGDEITLNHLADEILQSPPPQGFLTISNALQWRLQYGHIVGLAEKIEGITKIA